MADSQLIKGKSVKEARDVFSASIIQGAERGAKFGHDNADTIQSSGLSGKF